jgi:predicted HTH transcriptional regulator
MKAIAALLNTEGGVLLIGVDDDQNPIGIDRDNFESNDVFLRTLSQLIETSMGAEVSAIVKTEICKHMGKSICWVDCPKSPRPVFLQAKGVASDELYVRNGSISKALRGEELNRYAADRF